MGLVDDTINKKERVRAILEESSARLRAKIEARRASKSVRASVESEALIESEAVPPVPAEPVKPESKEPVFDGEITDDEIQRGDQEVELKGIDKEAEEWAKNLKVDEDLSLEAGASENQKIDEKAQSDALDDFVRDVRRSDEARKINEIMNGEAKEKEEPSETAKKLKRTWGWIKERLKGLASGGITEVHQAEKFRSGTKKTAEELSDKAFREADENIKHIGGGVVGDEDRRLTLEEAEEEAVKMEEIGGSENPGIRESHFGDDYERYSEAVTREKIAQNDAYIDTLVDGAEGKIREYLQKYKNEFGESVLNEDKFKKFREKLKEQLLDLRKGVETRNATQQYLGLNQEQLKRIMRESLDPKYWRRYVYAGTELAIDSLLIYGAASYLGAHSVSVSHAASGVVPQAPPVAGVEQLTGNVPMHNNIWATMKEFGAQKFGLKNMTNRELLKITRAVCKSNGIGVDLWNLTGSPMDTMMSEGHPIKITAEVAKVFKEILMAHGM